MRSNRLGLEIIVDGRPLPEYTHNGRIYVPAPSGREYELRLIVPNNSERHLAVCSVDGLDIMTGKAASTKAGGYVITRASHATDNDIRGFRLNDRDIARFKFGDRSDSYAALMDKPQNIGVIAVVWYAEYIPPRRESNLECAPGGGLLGGGTRGGTRGGHDMGTEFGRREEQRVSHTEFARGSEAARFVIEYASRESLVERGIIHESELGEVDPFPGDSGSQPPRGWNG